MVLLYSSHTVLYPRLEAARGEPMHVRCGRPLPAATSADSLMNICFIRARTNQGVDGDLIASRSSPHDCASRDVASIAGVGSDTTSVLVCTTYTWFPEPLQMVIRK